MRGDDKTKVIQELQASIAQVLVRVEEGFADTSRNIACQSGLVEAFSVLMQPSQSVSPSEGRKSVVESDFPPIRDRGGQGGPTVGGGNSGRAAHVGILGGEGGSITSADVENAAKAHDSIVLPPASDRPYTVIPLFCYLTI